MPMRTQERRAREPLVLTFVLVAHLIVVLLISRSAHQQVHASKSVLDALVFLILPRQPVAKPNEVPSASKSPAAKTRPSKPARLAAARITIPSPQTPSNKIDWEHETQLAVQDALANAEKERNYRDLAALSPEQLKWVRENKYVPAPPGIPWTYRRVDVSQGGFPVIHINDHCVLIPLMMMMVFCKIGHIEPKGHLFQHMH
jgi:hypothetical protein